jgi:hypothetical protein
MARISPSQAFYINLISIEFDHLSGLVAGVPGYRSRDPGFDFWSYQIF